MTIIERLEQRLRAAVRARSTARLHGALQMAPRHTLLMLRTYALQWAVAARWWSEAEKLLWVIDATHPGTVWHAFDTLLGPCDSTFAIDTEQAVELSYRSLGRLHRGLRRHALFRPTKTILRRVLRGNPGAHELRDYGTAFIGAIQRRDAETYDALRQTLFPGRQREEYYRESLAAVSMGTEAPQDALVAMAQQSPDEWPPLDRADVAGLLRHGADPDDVFRVYHAQHAGPDAAAEANYINLQDPDRDITGVLVPQNAWNNAVLADLHGQRLHIANEWCRFRTRRREAVRQILLDREREFSLDLAKFVAGFVP